MVVDSRKRMSISAVARVGRRNDRDQRARPALLHLHRRVEDVERAGREQPSISGPNSCGFMSSISHSSLTIAGRRWTAPTRSPRRIRSTFGVSFGVAVASAVADLAIRHRRQRTERSRVARHEQRAGRRHQLRRAVAVDRDAGEQPRRRRRRHGKHAVRAVHRAATDVERRRDHVVDAEPLEGVHRSDDVDDRVEGADLVEMDLLDRRVVDRRFGLGQPLEQMRLRRSCPSADSADRRDRGDDVRQVMMRMMMCGVRGSCAGGSERSRSPRPAGTWSPTRRRAAPGRRATSP